jgi:ABC-type transporter Mla MlaB component
MRPGLFTRKTGMSTNLYESCHTQAKSGTTFAFSSRPETTMLRITQTLGTDTVLTLKLEGKLLEPWTDELLRVCSQRTSEQTLRLDLAALTYADAVGVSLLASLIRRGTVVISCSGFVQELLQKEKNDCFQRPND